MPATVDDWGVVREQLDAADAVLKPHGLTLLDWDSELEASFEELEHMGVEDRDRESLAFSYGYLRGTADFCNLTIEGLLEEVTSDPR